MFSRVMADKESMDLGHICTHTYCISGILCHVYGMSKVPTGDFLPTYNLKQKIFIAQSLVMMSFKN